LLVYTKGQSYGVYVIVIEIVLLALNRN